MSKNQEIDKLMRMAGIAIANEELEQGGHVSEVGFETTYDLCGKEACAITRFSVVFWDGSKTKFMALDLKSVMELQNIITREFDVEL